MFDLLISVYNITSRSSSAGGGGEINTQKNISKILKTTLLRIIEYTSLIHSWIHTKLQIHRGLKGSTELVLALKVT
jgi:hypothetical protein